LCTTNGCHDQDEEFPEDEDLPEGSEDEDFPEASHVRTTSMRGKPHHRLSSGEKKPTEVQIYNLRLGLCHELIIF